jgi:hypothetical protein
MNRANRDQSPLTVPRPFRGAGFWFLQVSGWLFVLYLITAQGISAFDYELGVSMGTQDAVDNVTEIGVAFWRGFAIAYVIVYIPLFLIGLVGHFIGKNWGKIALAGALAITIYWPITCFIAITIAKKSEAWTAELPFVYYIVLPVFVVWGLWGLWMLKHTEITD